MFSEEILPYIAIHELLNNENLEKINNEILIPNIPNIISKRKSSMEINWLYLVDNGYFLIIYVKKNVIPLILKSLFYV